VGIAHKLFFKIGRVEGRMTSQTEGQSSESSNDAHDQQAASSQETTSSQEAGQELIDELTRLGQKFVEVVEVAWNSEQRKKIEDDLRTGLVTVAHTLEDGFKRVSNTKEAKEAVNAAEDVAEKVRTSKITVELSEALAQGLRSLSEQMEKLSEEMRQKSTASSEGKSPGSTQESQDIPIDKSPE
jgi:DNA polymerase III alpha subunit